MNSPSNVQGSRTAGATRLSPQAGRCIVVTWTAREEDSARHVPIVASGAEPLLNMTIPAQYVDHLPSPIVNLMPT